MRFDKWFSIKETQNVSLGTFASQIADPTWHGLYNKFQTGYMQNPTDHTVSQLGLALYQAATSKNMNYLNPYRNI